MAIDYAGNSLGTAKEFNITPSIQIFTDSVSNLDTNDYYRFSLSNRSSFQLKLDGLTANANVQLLNSTGSIIQTSSKTGTAAESISRTLDAGNYYIRVYPSSSRISTSYNLQTSATAIETTPTTTPSTELGNTLGTAEVRTAVFSQSEQVSASDRNDFYRFNVSESGIFQANLTGLTGDADVRLIQDSNNNGSIDQGEVRGWQWERGTQSESIRSFLNSGTYFLQVMSYNSQSADYNVATNFTAAASDNRQFSVNVNFVTGSEGLSDAMKNAVKEAGQFWQNVISHSSFNSTHTLNIDVGGTVQQWSSSGGVLASAGPRSISKDAAGRWMPTSGVSQINTNPDAVKALTSSIDYFRRVMIHEFAHVLGLGTFWGSESYGRNLVDRSTGTYNSNTYAGWAYGEMLGTYKQTAIPVTTGVGEGSDYSHWREGVFGNEVMTHSANYGSMPLSQMTIASLRDLGWNVNYGAAEAYSMPS